MQIETMDLSESIEFNVLGENKKKSQIILCDTGRNYKDYINSLKYRYNKKNPYLPNYVLSKKGDVYTIIKPEFYSKFMNNKDIDSKSIIICLENLGWYKKNPLEDSYVNWVGDIYKEEVFEKKWRDQLFWDLYTENQIIVLGDLIKKLCAKFSIPKYIVDSNVRHEGIENYKGVVARSNFDFLHKDVNPSFNFKLLKTIVEND